MVVDGKGVPLGITVDAANRHDMKITKTTLQSIVVNRPEPTTRAKQHMCRHITTRKGPKLYLLCYKLERIQSVLAVKRVQSVLVFKRVSDLVALILPPMNEMYVLSFFINCGHWIKSRPINIKYMKADSPEI